MISRSKTPFEEIMGETFADKPTNWQTGWQSGKVAHTQKDYLGRRRRHEKRLNHSAASQAPGNALVCRVVIIFWEVSCGLAEDIPLTASKLKRIP